MDNKIIVFYDTENISSLAVFPVVEKSIKKYGKVASMRIYHDFVGKDNQWKKMCFDLGYLPCQIMKPKKNTADLMITIDAIKLAHSSSCNMFCFVTNDSDFAPISLALRELGKETLLISTNNDKSINNYYNECEFINVSSKEKAPITINKLDKKANTDIAQNLVVKVDKEPPKISKETINAFIDNVYNSAKKDTEKWASYSTLCSSLARKFKNVNYSDYGFKNKKEFITNCGYEIIIPNIRKVIKK